MTSRITIIIIITAITHTAMGNGHGNFPYLSSPLLLATEAAQALHFRSTPHHLTYHGRCYHSCCCRRRPLRLLVLHLPPSPPPPAPAPASPPSLTVTSTSADITGFKPPAPSIEQGSTRAATGETFSLMVKPFLNLPLLLLRRHDFSDVAQSYRPTTHVPNAC